MVTIRRWYVYLVCAISLQSVAWAVIWLLRNTLLGDGTALGTAFQLAVIIIGLPVFLAHWWWAQRLAGRDLDERESALRRVYLYGMQAGFITPLLVNLYDLVEVSLRLAVGGTVFSAVSAAMAQDIIALGVLALLWLYHWRTSASDARAAPEQGASATVRRWYVLGFSAAGLAMTSGAVSDVLRWVLYQFGASPDVIQSRPFLLTASLALLIVGLPTWLIFWNWAQGLFAGPSPEEHASTLRKFYLYAVVFAAVLVVVTNATMLLAGFLRAGLGLEPQGDVRDVLPALLGLGVVWAYHAWRLRRDEARVEEAPRQAGLRRLYWYLVAAIGLAAFLVGLGGDLSVLIRSLSEQYFTDDLREQLAWCTAALLAGLPVWLWPWRRAQLAAVGAAGAEERRSIVRKLFLYFYLFVATLTVLSTLIYIVYRLLSLALGELATGNLLADLAHAIAFALMAVGVWLYHGAALRGDGRLNQQEQAQRLAEVQVVVVDGGDGRFGRAVLEGLRRELPGLRLNSIGLNPAAAQAMGGVTPVAEQPQRLAEAGLIVGPWNIAVADGQTAGEIARAVVASPARKVLYPARAAGWEWAGVDRWNADAGVRQTVQAVKQCLAGEEIRPARPLGAGAIIAIIVGGAIVLYLLALPILYLFGRL
jgi:hypothetical protein